jgi:hypothetical protein
MAAILTTRPSVRLRSPIPKMSEKRFQAKVKRLAELCGWLPYHTFDSRCSDPGFPDLVLVRRGRGIAAELKCDGEDPRPDQQRWLDEFAAIPGFLAVCWHPQDMDQIVQELV